MEEELWGHINSGWVQIMELLFSFFVITVIIVSATILLSFLPITERWQLTGRRRVKRRFCERGMTIHRSFQIWPRSLVSGQVKILRFLQQQLWEQRGQAFRWKGVHWKQMNHWADSLTTCRHWGVLTFLETMSWTLIKTLNSFNKYPFTLTRKEKGVRTIQEVKVIGNIGDQRKEDGGKEWTLGFWLVLTDRWYNHSDRKP